ncbi:nuclease-related domain-containing protein [Sporosarcina trichiuri]|uniref:nuclease-related domain-containing protein n=1 Tax=Sporosarcina trichiuri TaxID=3056445 RepID=UPI0025B49886|nr:nuclease-related domain-containing protein [Sporosarcina sp. 0.2-SM1T-5]WJY26561.1 nuclease-related domain-containing protein [Sporosarcina sp. 0.2-SM1T-5]
MLMKQRTAPEQLKGLQALARRLPVSHEKYRFIQEELYKQRAGYGGEQEYDRCMQEVRTDYSHAILHDLSLRHDRVRFQLDSVFIAPDRIVITEVKNVADRIVVKANPLQFLKETPGGTRTVFRSPAAELERKIHFLTGWLSDRGIDVPVTGLISFAHHNELIFEEEPAIPVVSNYEAPSYFRNLRMEEERLSERDIRLLADELIACHNPYSPFPLTDRYGIAPDDLKTGLLCGSCSSDIAMILEGRKWKCLQCGETSRTPYEQAIEEYFMLAGRKLTNRTFCRFTGVTCRHTVKRALQHPLLRQSGTRKAAVYTLAD